MGAIRILASTFLVSAALVAGLPTVPAIAAEPEDASATDGFNALSTFPEFASLPDSAASDLPLVLHGAVEQITGAAMPGAQILLSAWPSNDSIVRLPVGAEFALTPIARTVADDSGTYTLRASVTGLLRSLSGPDGLDIELDVFHGDRHYTHLSQVTPTADGSWIRELTGLLEPVDQAVEAASNLLDLTLDRTKAAVEAGLGITGAGPVAADYRKPVPPGCTPFVKVGEELAWQTVATSLTTTPHVTAEVTYTRSARTESSVGSSYQGGAFSAAGSRSRTMTLEATFDDDEVKRRRLTNVEYQMRVLHGIFRRSCARDFRGNEDVAHMTSPLAITTESRIVAAGRERPAWRCAPDDGRTIKTGFKDYTVSKERAAVYQRAFALNPIPGAGFAGSSLSGYSSSVSIIMRFRLPKSAPFRPKYICGDTGRPDTRGQRIQGFFG